MQAVFDLTVATENLGRVAQDVFTVMADMALEPSEETLQTECYNALLLFRAPVRAALLMECEPKAAAVLTRRMLGLEKVPVGFNSDVRDCLGELVNMVGGNLRNFFPELESLDTTPTVFVGAPDTTAQDEAAGPTFETGAGRVRFSLR